ncbi:MAG TPA: archease [Burkholderiales bacterium]|nr:archease [Burkholderiales bacterium]
MPRSSDLFEHDADFGVVGRGGSVEEAFVAAAEAMFGIMIDPGAVAAKESVAFEFEETDVELALVTWLNALLAHARDRGLALGRFELVREGARWRGRAAGEPWRAGFDRGTEVKGATLTMLSVRRADGGWEARCIVDV